jgi:protein phosphatase
VDLAYNGNDFALLCCDGVFESNFSNEQIIEFVVNEMKASNDLAAISGRVCEEAVSRGSRDNISCMILQFTNGTDYGALRSCVQVVPGPFSAPKHNIFRRVYATMAGKGGMTVDKVLEDRYDFISNAPNKAEFAEELEIFKGGPPADLRGPARTQWFENFFAQFGSDKADSRSEQMQRIQFLQQQVGVPLPILLSLMGDGGRGSEDN